MSYANQMFPNIALFSRVCQVGLKCKPQQAYMLQSLLQNQSNVLLLLGHVQYFVLKAIHIECQCPQYLLTDKCHSSFALRPSKKLPTKTVPGLKFTSKEKPFLGLILFVVRIFTAPPICYITTVQTILASHIQSPVKNTWGVACSCDGVICEDGVEECKIN